MYFKNALSCCLVIALLVCPINIALSATLGQAFLLFEKHDYLGAAVLFYELESSELSDSARDEAQMGLARSLSKAGLSLSALHMQEAIVAKGASHRYFSEALMGLITSANDIGGEVLISQLLDKTYGQNLDVLAKLDANALQHLHFMLSKRAFRAGRADESFEFANSLQSTHDAFARSQYLLGVLRVSDTKAVRDEAYYRELLKLFDLAGEGGKGIKELSQLAKARIFYERGMNAERGSSEQRQHIEKAIQFYRQTPSSSPQFQKALFEKAWAHTILNQADLALGALYALGHPKFEGAHNPESEILQAINYLSLCDYEEANKAVKRLERRYSSKRADAPTPPSDDKDQQATVFKKLIDQLDAEVVRLNASEIRISPLALELSAYLNDSKGALGKATEAWKKQRVAQQRSQIEKALTKAKMISVEASTKEAQLLSNGVNTARSMKAAPKEATPGPGADRWIGTGQELWGDELSDLRVRTVSRCL